MSDNLIVGSKTRAALKAHGVNVGADALDALNEVVHWHVGQAAKRAAANRRKTVRAYDIVVIEAEAAQPVEAAPAPAASYEADTGIAGGSDTHGDAGAAEEAASEAPTDTWSG